QLCDKNETVAELPQAISVDDVLQRETNAPEPLRGVSRSATCKRAENEIDEPGKRRPISLKPPAHDERTG
ncbi:hypothetical protein, partial [uncultured Senegalimassilia sp.]|uniref:hypothetical protein n=1 Tax=uncultured Senegalimassilia sp. TaxID=1714350 RepID=UPI0025FC6977